MAKIIGMLCGWAAKDFIKPAMTQAIEFCDEVNVCIAPHSESMEKYEDGTLAIAKSFCDNDKVRWFEFGTGKANNHATAKANILNAMLMNSKYCEPGNWIWILDADEFYPDRTYKQVKKIIRAGVHDRIDFEEFYFYINTKYFLEGDHLRVFKIKSMDDIFYPTQRWLGATKPVCLARYSLGMYHYGMLTNPWAKIDFWKTEYPVGNQINKIDWMEKIYKNYDLKDQRFWSTVNFNLFGLMSPWFSPSFKSNPDGTLLEYDESVLGPHPKFIDDSLLSVRDFRDKFDFAVNP